MCSEQRRAESEVESFEESIRLVILLIEALCRAEIDLRFRWSADHEGVVGNEEADDAAREASIQAGKPAAPVLEKVRGVAGVIRLINRSRSEDPNPFDTTRLLG
jgi:hypothetical protein